MMMHRIGSLQERQFGPRLCGRRVENCGSTQYSNKLEISCLTHCVGDVVVRRSVVNVGIVAACMLHQGDFWILVDVLTVHNRRTFHYIVSKSPCSRELWKAISVEQPSAWYSSGDSLIVVVWKNTCTCACWCPSCAQTWSLNILGCMHMCVFEAALRLSSSIWSGVPLVNMHIIRVCFQLTFFCIYMFASSGAPIWLQRWAAISIEMVSKISSCHRIVLNAIMHW